MEIERFWIPSKIKPPKLVHDDPERVDYGHSIWCDLVINTNSKYIPRGFMIEKGYWCPDEGKWFVDYGYDDQYAWFEPSRVVGWAECIQSKAPSTEEFDMLVRKY